MKNLLVRRGEPVTAARWNALLRWAEQFTLYAGGGVRLTRTPSGTWISMVSRHTWAHPFRVSTSGSAVRIAFGTVNNEVPFIGETRIDGTDLDYKPVDGGLPTLDISETTQAAGRSFVGVQVGLDGVNGDFLPGEEGLSIVHLPETEEALPAGFQPFAVFYWIDDRVVKTLQIVHHDLAHYFVAGADDDSNRHYFAAL